MNNSKVIYKFLISDYVSMKDNFINRNASTELLRIILMLFIISHHFLIHGMHIMDNDQGNHFLLFLTNSTMLISVNVFILISGYYGMRFNMLKLFRLYLLTAVVGGLCYLSYLLIDGVSFGRSCIYHTVFSISHTKLWFVKTYIYLFLLSPIINVALRNFDKKQCQQAIFLLTLICLYFGWFWQDNINANGYSVINFIWIYCMGHYIHHYFNYRKVSAYIYIIIWILAAITNTILSILLKSYIAWTYNNPLVVISSISFFLFFISFNFQSKTISFLARSTLTVYLIHENSYISRFVYGEKFATIYADNVFYFLMSVLFVYFSCLLVDLFIQNVIVNPIMNMINKYHHVCNG